MTISLLLLLLQERGGRLNAKKRYMLTRQTQLPLEERLFIGKHLENGTLNKNGFFRVLGFGFFFLFFLKPHHAVQKQTTTTTTDDRRPTTDDRRGVDLCRYFLRRTEIFLSFFGNIIISSTHHI